ncbi:hypothetical protein [Microlunatus ginsengisoli]|uniref:Uncharacterized protein n=1 Tax=Microlunatus ginsengisoli TaxID=363863 RepID=A0ABP6ZM13_9ACTN
MKAWRIGLSVLGLVALAFGLVELTTGVSPVSLLRVAVWLVAALIIHDALWSPALLGVGGLLTRVPARGRRYLQAGLLIGGALTVIAVPMIYLRGSQPASKAILLQNVGLNLVLLLAIVAVVTGLAYALRVVLDRGRQHAEATSGNPLPDRDPA